MTQPTVTNHMREKGVACNIFDYSLMFLHTLYTSKEMFNFIESMDNDYNNVCKRKMYIDFGQVLPASLNEPIYTGLANQLVLEQGTSQAKETMSFLNERNYDEDGKL